MNKLSTSERYRKVHAMLGEEMCKKLKNRGVTIGGDEVAYRTIVRNLQIGSWIYSTSSRESNFVAEGMDKNVTQSWFCIRGIHVHQLVDYLQKGVDQALSECEDDVDLGRVLRAKRQAELEKFKQEMVYGQITSFIQLTIGPEVFSVGNVTLYRPQNKCPAMDLDRIDRKCPLQFGGNNVQYINLKKIESPIALGPVWTPEVANLKKKRSRGVVVEKETSMWTVMPLFK